MTDQARLIIKLEAENAKLHRQLDTSEKKIKRFSGAARKNADLIKKAFGAIGVAVLVRQFASLTREALQLGDALAKNAAKMGIATEDLAGLGRAAQLTGVAQETLYKAITKQQKAIYDANRGLVTYKQHFDELGLSTEDLMKLSPDQQFIKIAGALNKLGNQTQKTAILYDVFGGRATALLNTLALGEDGLKAVTDQAKYLGIAISEKTAKKMEDFNDSMLTLHQSLLGVANVVIEFAGPALTEFVNTLAYGTPQYTRKFIGGIKTIQLGLKELSATYYESIAAFDGFMEKITFGSAAKLFKEGQRQAQQQALDLRVQAMGLATELQNISNKIEDLDNKRKQFMVSPGSAVGNPVEQIVGTKQEWSETLYWQQDMMRAHISDLNKLQSENRINQKKNMTEEQKLWESGWKGRTGIVADALGSVGSLMMQGSKKQFEIGKKLNLAAAIANTAQAITNALAVPPFPLGLTLATTAAAAGLAQIQAIRGTTFGGGGTVNTASGSFNTSSPSYNAIDVPTSQTSQSDTGGKTVQVNITAMDTQSAAEVIAANRGLITSLVTNDYRDRGINLGAA